ncbi:MAG: pyridoxine 5'-phosphate synthase [Gammaproteobacteria bacterium]|nr:pyridoxine 5'-phosphate synthase [Gammaproteobacteria bacterium]MDE0157042.1 pyridoxine 5'-phosphate synthase [Gammaproteobacteria bacterium]
MKPIKLGVNIDHVATLRQARLTRYPEPVHAALVAEQAGADSITVHLREDRRHIQERDVEMLKDVLTIPINLEMAVTDEMLALAETYKPEYCCFVPERREELTTEGGLEVIGQQERIREACARLQANGSRVSLFIDADAGQIDAAVNAGADMIEIHTGHYADSDSPETQDMEFNKIVRAVEHAAGTPLQINAGHGLHYHNVKPVAAIEQVAELNIGHSIIARAVFSGLYQAVKDMKTLMDEARR